MKIRSVSDKIRGKQKMFILTLILGKIIHNPKNAALIRCWTEITLEKSSINNARSVSQNARYAHSLKTSILCPYVYLIEQNLVSKITSSPPKDLVTFVRISFVR